MNGWNKTNKKWINKWHEIEMNNSTFKKKPRKKYIEKLVVITKNATKKTLCLWNRESKKKTVGYTEQRQQKLKAKYKTINLRFIRRVYYCVSVCLLYVFQYTYLIRWVNNISNKFKAFTGYYKSSHILVGTYILDSCVNQIKFNQIKYRMCVHYKIRIVYIMSTGNIKAFAIETACE